MLFNELDNLRVLSALFNLLCLSFWNIFLDRISRRQTDCGLGNGRLRALCTCGGEGHGSNGGYCDGRLEANAGEGLNIYISSLIQYFIRLPSTLLIPFT